MATGPARRTRPALPKDATRQIDPGPGGRPPAKGQRTKPSGHKSHFVPRAGQLLAEYRDPVTGDTYPTRALLREAIRRRKSRILRDFAELVETKTLGQDPWGQLPGETPLQYARFRVYLTMSPKEVIFDPRTGKQIGAVGNRSVRRAEAKLGLREGGLIKLSQSRHWLLRATCWDRELERVQDEEFREARRTSARRQARLGAKLQELAGDAIDTYSRNVRLGTQEVDGNTIARLVDIGVKTERLAMGDATSHEVKDQTTTLVWQGARPKWADSAELVVEQEQIVRGPLEQRLLDATDITPNPKDGTGA